jgi:hypothetical protein
LDSSYAIQEFRCRLMPDVLAGERIAYLDFPYQQAIQDWIERMTTLLTAQGRKWLESDNPPYRALNKLLMALTPSLIHPFERYSLHTVNNESLFVRKMLTFEQAFRPSLKQLEPVVRVWLRHWIEDRFADEVKTPLGNEAYTDLLQALSHPETQWQSIQADQLFGDVQNRLLYRAVPSLLAVRLVGKDSEIRGHHVTWQLTQEAGSNRLALVSQPFRSTFPDPYNPVQQVHGYFAYHVEFGAQTVPDDPIPFIDVSISCRRYVEAPLKKLNYRRRVTVMMGTQTPRLEDWPVEPTMVPISIRGEEQAFWWDDALPDLLKDLRARPLEDIMQIAADPQVYWSPAEHTGDRYFLLYSEGMEPDHPLETGFGPVELYAVWQAILQQCEGYLFPDKPLARDDQNIRLDRTISMLPVWELSDRERKQHKIIVDGKKKLQPLDDDIKCSFGSKALQQSGLELPVRFLFFYRTEQMRDAVVKLFRECLLWQGKEIELLEPIRVDDVLVAPLEHGTIDVNFRKELKGRPKKEREEKTEQWRQAVEQGRRQRLKAWRSLLASVRPANGTILALIEIPFESIVRDELNPRPAIREECVRAKIGSQLLVSPKKGVGDGDLSRAKNALADLLIRQTGLLYGDVTDVYRMAGVPTDLSRQVIIVGLARVRKTKYELDYTVAVRILPSGRIEMLLPEAGQQWQPYFSGCMDLGEIFRSAPPSKKKRHQKMIKLPKNRISQFLQGACISSSEPTIVFLGAQDFRSVWPQLQNPDMELNTLFLCQNEPPLTPDLVSPLWMVRIREAGSLGETPQYVRLLKGIDSTSDDAHYAQGIYDLAVSGKFPIFHTIGRGPGSGDRREWLKAALGGGRAFKRQHVVEAVPFFLSDECLSLALGRISYFLRFPPTWENGTTLSPWPMHLGGAALDDYLCLLPGVDEGDEAE